MLTCSKVLWNQRVAGCQSIEPLVVAHALYLCWLTAVCSSLAQSNAMALSQAIPMHLRRLLIVLVWSSCKQYIQCAHPFCFFLLCLDVLQFLRLINEIVRVCLWRKPPFSRLLHKILIPLLLCESDCILLRLEVEMCSLHEISRGLPSH